MRLGRGCHKLILRRAWGLFPAIIATALTGAAPPEGPDGPKPAVRVTRLISPDGRREAHGLIVVGPKGEQTSKIVVADADGSGRRALDIKLAGPVDVSWFGDDRLAYAPEGDERAYEVIDLEGQHRETIRLPEACRVLYKCLSPDGRLVAYCGGLVSGGEGRGSSGLFIVEVAGGKVRQVLSEAVKTAPAWSPDSRRIAIGGAGGYVKDYPLTVIDVENGKAEKVGCNGVAAAWSPDGRWLAFTTEVVRGGSWSRGIPLDGRIGIWDLDRKALTLISPPGINRTDQATNRWEYAGSYLPVWSPDGRRIAYQHYESIRARGVDEQKEETWVVERDGNGARKLLNHSAEVAWLPDGKTLVWMQKGRVGRVVLDEEARLGPTPPQPHGEFSITGIITDEDGRPLPGVAVKVARGWYTLFNTDPVETDEKGRYEIHFDPGMMIGDDVQLQCAIVHASKPGYYEKDLCRGGRLGMAYKKPAGKRADEFVGIVYPDNPYPLDFIMLPAARLRARLVDADRKPLARYNVYLIGESWPATNVLAALETDDQGRFCFEEVPRKPYRFQIGSGRGAQIESDPLPFVKAGDYEVVVVYEALDATLEWELASGSR